MRITRNDTLLFIGDSITDSGRDRDDPASLGSGYVAEVAGELRARMGPDGGPTVVNKGLNGNRAQDLEARWTTDVIDIEPTLLTVKVGINDTWRHYDRGLISPVDEFEACLNRLLTRTLTGRRVPRVVMITPFLIPASEEQELWHEDLAPRTDAVLAVAKTHGVRVVRADQILPRAAEEHGAALLAPDGVHPTPLGHRILADAWLAAVDA